MRAYARMLRAATAGVSPALAIALTVLSSAPAQASAVTGHVASASTARLAGTTGTARPPAARPASINARPAKASAAIPGYTPAALRSAYNVVKTAPHGGRGLTVAVVSAYSDPRAAADLAVYRKHFHLSACSTASKCLRIVNEHGNTRPLPTPDPSWAASDAIALDAVSGLCPGCHLLLIEASSNLDQDLDPAVSTAVAKGAKVVIYGAYGTESPAQDVYDHYFNHPGVAIIAPAGNGGATRTFPADLPDVTAVGGTTLTRTRFSTRHWAEVAWDLTGSGCSALEPKPSWQNVDANPSTGCMNRTANDVAADADPATGAAVYNSYGTTQHWVKAGGTMLAGAIVAAVYALAGAPARGTYPASYPYEHHRYLYDVSHGNNGSCLLLPQYLCNARKGFDGPTGLGTPDGTGAFAAKGTDPVTVMDPGTQDDEAGTAFSVRISGLDSRPGGTLRYSAKGLPAGLKISAVPKSASARISGILPTAEASYTVTVTAKDAKTGKVATTRFAIVAAGSLTPATPVTGAIDTDSSFQTPPAFGQCLDSGAGTAGTTVTIQSCTGTAEQLWSYVPQGKPGGPAEIKINGLCLGLAAGTVDLATCDTATSSQNWRQLYGGPLEDLGAGKCLDAGNYANPLTLQACDTAIGYQQWHLLGGTVQSGVHGMCVATDRSQGLSQPATMVIEPCGLSGQDYVYSFGLDGRIYASTGCISAAGDGTVDSICGTNGADQWIPLANGELVNEELALCLDDPGNSTVAGTQLVVRACYGTLGEIWALA
jgi:hypothetical protein